MPWAIKMDWTSAWSVPVPGLNGFSLFADVNNNWSPTIKLPNGTLQALWILPPGGCGCGSCGGWWWSWCACMDVANCIDTDALVQNSLTTFNNNYYSTVATLWSLSDVDLTWLADTNLLQYNLGSNTWIPVAFPAWWTDELFKVSATDTTSGYGNDKIVVWASNNLVKTILNWGWDEDLELELNTTLTGLTSITVTTLNATNVNTTDLDVTWTATIATANITDINITNTPTIPGLEQIQETPTWVIDWVNTSFTLSFAPTNNIITLFVWWVPQHPTVNYTVVGTALTFTTAPIWGPITATYFK